MRMRKILIIHEARTTLSILKTYVISELNDAVVVEASSAAEGIEKLKESEFDVVVCGKTFREMDGISIYKEMCECENNKETPFVIITSSGSDKNIKELTDQGIEHYLISPFTPLELREIINVVCDPRKWRIHDRISVPDTKAVIHLNNDNVEADVINISMSGVLCDLICEKSYNELLNSTHITVNSPDKYDGAQIKILWCKIFRVNVLDWNTVYFPQCIPNHIRVIWQIVQISDEDKKVFENICNKVKKGYERIQSAREN